MFELVFYAIYKVIMLTTVSASSISYFESIRM